MRSKALAPQPCSAMIVGCGPGVGRLVQGVREIHERSPPALVSPPASASLSRCNSARRLREAPPLRSRRHDPARDATRRDACRSISRCATPSTSTVELARMRPDGKTDPAIAAELLGARRRARRRSTSRRSSGSSARLAARLAAAIDVRARRASRRCRACARCSKRVGRRSALRERGADRQPRRAPRELKLRAAGLAEFFAVGAFGSDHVAARGAAGRRARALPGAHRSRRRARAIA